MTAKKKTTKPDEKPESGKATAEEVKEIKAREADPKLVDMQETIDDLEAEIAELKAERAALTHEKANAELVEQLENLQNVLAEREATIKELSKPIAKEAFQAAAKAHPEWLPAPREPGISASDFAARIIQLEKDLQDNIKRLIEGPVHELALIKKAARTGGIR